MLRVPVDKIEPGMILARPIPIPRDARRFLLQRDREVPMDLVPRLKAMGVLEVWIRHRDLELLEDLVDEEVSDCQREVYVQVRGNFESIMEGAVPDMDMAAFQGPISELFGCLKQSNHGNFLLQKLDSFDNYLMSHSTNVCYLAMLLGMKLERYLIEQRSAKTARDAKDLRLLGLGCLLHDVGKMLVPPEILNKPGRLTDDEMQIMREHPVYGYEMVKGKVSPVASQVVLNHHQRYDGTGYPERKDSRTGDPLPPLVGEQIAVFSRIATIVDVYDAATAKRCYGDAKLPVQVLHEMRTWHAGHFDPTIEKAFREIIPAFPLGQVVELSDGSEAVVVDFNPDQPVRPKVQLLRWPNGERVLDPALEETDLVLYPELGIAAVNGVDVRPFMTSQDVHATVGVS